IIPKLRHNRDLNHCQFEIVGRALAYEADEVSFTVGENTLVGSLLVAGAHKVQVRSITLAELTARCGFERFTLACDIEGSEVEMVKREHALIASAVETLILETHPDITGRPAINLMLETLRGSGFAVIEDSHGKMVLRNCACPAPLGSRHPA